MIAWNMNAIMNLGIWRIYGFLEISCGMIGFLAMDEYVIWDDDMVLPYSPELFFFSLVFFARRFHMVSICFNGRYLHVTNMSKWKLTSPK